VLNAERNVKFRSSQTARGPFIAENVTQKEDPQADIKCQVDVFALLLKTSSLFVSLFLFRETFILCGDFKPAYRLIGAAETYSFGSYFCGC
jgi:hypothetical protein